MDRIPDNVRQKFIELALEEPDLSPREIVVMFMDRERSYVSEASVYQVLKARGLIASLLARDLLIDQLKL